MAGLNDTISSLLRQATLDIAREDFVSAKNKFKEAAKFALAMAKQTKGAEQKKNVELFNYIMKKIEDVEVKILLQNRGSSGNSLPTTPYSGAGDTANNKPSVDTPPAPTYEAPKTPSAPPAPPAPEYKKDSGHSGGKSGGTGQFIGSLSPKWLSDYIGQPQAVTAVKDLITAALLRGSALPHIILYGSHGLGKTTFSKIIANEMHANFIEVNVTNINMAGMVAILKQLKPNDILFIDEIHTLPTQVAEAVLYSALQDGRITYVEGKGKLARTETFELPPFTLIGATTEIGKIAKPFTQRAIQVRLEEYSDEVLARIITASFYKLGMKITEELSLKISKRCRNNPRIANNMVKRISDKALVRYAAMNNIKSNGFFSNIEEIKKSGLLVEEVVVNDFFEENGIDEFGLESGDRELLRIIITRYGGGPVGIDTLARALNEANNVISQKYEAYLIKKGMLKIEREGRVVMAQGYRALKMPVPASVQELEKSTGKPEPEQPAKKYEKRKIIASHVRDELKCERIENLIVYPENAIVNDTPLDTLFPDVEKPYEDITKHACELEIDFGDHKRLLSCDSFLESRFATVLSQVGYLIDMKAQSLEIPYISLQLADRRYFPDFVIRDYKGRIAVIEMKNFDAACYHLNIDKYEQLAEYCRQRGYGYAEVMKPYNADEYTSIETLARKPVNKQLEEFIINKIEENAKTGDAEFTTKEWDEYNAKYGRVEKTEIYTVLLNNRRLRNIDRNGSGIRITLN